MITFINLHLSNVTAYHVDGKCALLPISKDLKCFSFIYYQCTPLIVITLGQSKIDNIIQMKPLSKLTSPNGNVWLPLGKQSLLAGTVYN
jgi:hypothetical protein